MGRFRQGMWGLTKIKNKILIIFLLEDKICNDKNKEKFCQENDYCTCTHLIEVDLNDTVEFVLVDAMFTKLPIILENKHPMHLHGYTFAVVAMNEVSVVSIGEESVLNYKFLVLF